MAGMTARLESRHSSYIQVELSTRFATRQNKIPSAESGSERDDCDASALLNWTDPGPNFDQHDSVCASRLCQFAVNMLTAKVVQRPTGPEPGKKSTWVAVLASLTFFGPLSVRQVGQPPSYAGTSVPPLSSYHSTDNPWTRGFRCHFVSNRLFLCS